MTKLPVKEVLIDFELLVDGGSYTSSENLEELFDYARTIDNAKHIAIYKITRTYELIIEGEQK
jgi:hypothetical protein